MMRNRNTTMLPLHTLLVTTAFFLIGVVQVLVLWAPQAQAQPLSTAIASESDFTEVNAILQTVVVKLPDAPTMDSLGYSIELYDLVCYDISFHDITLLSTQLGDTTTTTATATTATATTSTQIQLTVQGLDFVCEAKYKYRGLLGMVNRGDVYVSSSDNYVTTTATIFSAAAAATPVITTAIPTTIAMTNCVPTISIRDVDFSNGGFMGWILDAIEGLLRNAIENLASTKICNELSSFLEKDGTTFLTYISKTLLFPYYDEKDQNDSDSTTTQTTTEADTIRQYEQDFIQQLLLLSSSSSSSSATAIADAATTVTTSSSSIAATTEVETEVLNFREQNTETGTLIKELIQKGVAAASSSLTTTQNERGDDAASFSSTIKETDELQINQWLRDYVLTREDSNSHSNTNNNDSYSMIVSEYVGTDNTVQNVVLYDVEDTITHTTIVMDGVKLLGLDTLTEFTPFAMIGNYTMETMLAWEYLAIEIDMLITVRPSQLPDAAVSLVVPSSSSSSQQQQVEEHVKFTIGVKELTANTALFAAINRTSIEQDIRLGSLLQSTTVAMDCLLSTVLDLAFLTLNVTANDVLSPTISGFVSTGLDHLMDSAMDTVFILYEQILLRLAPNYFQHELRPILTTKLLHDYVLQRQQQQNNNSIGVDGNNNNGRTCVAPWTSTSSSTTSITNTMMEENNKSVDYRDLLLTRTDSIELGGSGNTERYGDIMSTMIVPYINNEILNATKINEQYIPAITKELQQQPQNSIKTTPTGTIVFEDVYDFHYDSRNTTRNDYKNKQQTSPTPSSSSSSSLLSSLIETMDIRISTITISNLDTVSGPLALFQPTEDEGGNILQNQFGFDSSSSSTSSSQSVHNDRNLNVTMRLIVNIDDDGNNADGKLSSPFQMNNAIDLSVSVPSTSFSIGILANLKERSLMEFPLKDIMNPYCWLATLGGGGGGSDAEEADTVLHDDNYTHAMNLAISSLTFSMSTFLLDSNCVDVNGNSDNKSNGTSNSPGCDSISELLTYLQQKTNFTASFRESIIILIEDTILSLWGSIDIDKILRDAPRYCPHSESYDLPLSQEDDEEKESNPVLSQLLENIDNNSLLSGISSNSSETIVALGVIALQSSMIVIAKNHLLLENQQFLPQDPFNPNDGRTTAKGTRTKFPEGVGIMDFTNLSDQYGSWVDTTFDEFRSYLSADVQLDAVPIGTADNDDKNVFMIRNVVESTLSSSSQFVNNDTIATVATAPRANVLLRDYILDDDGYLIIDLDNVTFSMLGFSISINQVRITGLDTITSIDPLIVLDPNTMTTTLQLNEFVVALNCTVTTTTIGERNGSFNGTSIIDQFELVYNANGISLDIDTRIAVNTTKIGKVQLGSVFDVSNIINCMMQGVQAFEISKLTFNLESIGRPVITAGSFLIERLTALQSIVDSLHDTYHHVFLQALPTLTGSTLRETLNMLIPNILESMTSKCPSPQEYPADGVIDFRELLRLNDEGDAFKAVVPSSLSYGNLFQVMYGVFDKEVMQTDGSNRPVLNDVLKSFTMKQSNSAGTIRITGIAMDTQSKIQVAGLQADFGLQISDVLIQNLDSVGDPLYLFRPVDNTPYVLDNKLSFGVDSKPIQFQGTLKLSIDDGEKMKIQNEINVSFSVEDVTVQASVLIKLLENSIASFPFEDFSNLNCWAASILPLSKDRGSFKGVQLLDQNYAIGDSDMDISCTSCTSPAFDDLLLSLYEPQDSKFYLIPRMHRH